MKNLETPGKTGRVGRHVVNIVVDKLTKQVNALAQSAIILSSPQSCSLSQFRTKYSLEDIKNSKMVFDPLTKLQCW